MKKLLCSLAAVSILMFPSYATDTIIEQDLPVAVSTSMISTYSQGVGTVNASGLNIREDPNEEANVLKTLNQDDKVIVLNKVGNWYCVNSEDIIGYVSCEYLNFSNTEETSLGYGQIKPEATIVRSEPETDSTVAGAIYGDEIVSIDGVSNEWYKIDFNGLVGYIRSDLMDPTALEPEPEPSIEYTQQNTAVVTTTPKEESSQNSATLINTTRPIVSNTEEIDSESEPTPSYIPDSEPAQDSASEASISSSVIEVAQQYIGIPYVWGGTSPSGFDCSGFTQYVFRQCGYSISRIAASQYNDGTYVSYDNLSSGDLVFFINTYATNGISHVGIYIGGGQFIHCANGGVKISSLSETYYSTRYYGACRIA